MAIRRRRVPGVPAGILPDPGGPEPLPDHLLALRHGNAFCPARLPGGVEWAAAPAHSPHGDQGSADLAWPPVPGYRLLRRRLLRATGRDARHCCAGRSCRGLEMGERPPALRRAAPARLDTGRGSACPGSDEVLAGELVSTGHTSAWAGTAPLPDRP